MKSILIIGLGRFGHHLCKNMAKYDNQIMIVDKDERKTEDLLEYASVARVGDCTDERVLMSFGIGNFDEVFVCMGSDFQSSLEVTSMVKELGAKHVISRATRDIHAKFLLRNGADQVIYPDKDAAERIARSASDDRVFDYIELKEGYGIYEIPPLKEWIGKSIVEANIRANYKLTILGHKHIETGELTLMPSPDYIFKEKEHLMVMSSEKDLEKVLKKIK